MGVFRLFWTISIFPAFFALFGCGYTLQNSRNSELGSVGIRRVFVAPVVNDTYRAGVEILVYNEMVRTLASEDILEVVRSEADADAVLKIRVGTASTSVLANTSSQNLFPSQAGVGIQGPTDRIVATLYNANLGADFTLTRTRSESGLPPVVWTGTFNRSHPFPATNQLGSLGTTSALINESEFDRALRELATALVAEAHTNMIIRF